jgi:ectoine hydroxylase-related dioxygenase (phytanoyl-CoA dioxygenase family)
MNPLLATDGYEIHRALLSDADVVELRLEADIVADAAGCACVRHLRRRSRRFDMLSVSSALLSLIPAGLRPVRSILFDKTKSENWPVLWHQDLTIAVAEEQQVPGYGPWSYKDGSPHVQPPVSLLENMVTIRLHLDETPATNGALMVIPKSHRSGRIDSEALSDYDKTGAVICECVPGDILLMSPLILHSSRRSKSPARRRVIHFEYACDEDLDSRLNWFEPSRPEISEPQRRSI